MDLAGPSAFAVDAADLGGEDEVDVGLAGGRNIFGLEFLLEPVTARCPAGSSFSLSSLSHPGMREVPCADDADAFELRPFPDAFGRHVLARCAGVVGVDVEVCDKTHGGL